MLAFAILPTGSTAQTSFYDPGISGVKFCYYNSIKYSPGVRLRNGPVIIECQARTWKKIEIDEDVGAMCMHKDEFYSEGAEINIGGISGMRINRCLSNGGWRSVPLK